MYVRSKHSCCSCKLDRCNSISISGLRYHTLEDVHLPCAAMGSVLLGHLLPNRSLFAIQSCAAARQPLHTLVRPGHQQFCFRGRMGSTCCRDMIVHCQDTWQPKRKAG
jgi:hypothetical protein